MPAVYRPSSTVYNKVAMRNLLPLLAALFITLAFTGPAHAQERDATPPALAPLKSVRDNVLLSFSGRPLQVCTREWQSWNRVHGVCRDLATATIYGERLIAGTVVEFVLFDGMRYERINDQQIWTAAPDADFAPELTLNEAFFSIIEPAIITRLGSVTIDGTPTDHYQFWVTDELRNELAGGQLIYDQFISPAGYVLRSTITVRGLIPGLGEGELVELRSFTGINEPVIITPPVAP